jgi:hypothetical protein
MSDQIRSSDTLRHRRAHCLRRPHCRYRRRLGKEASDVLYYLCSADNPQGIYSSPSSKRAKAMATARPVPAGRRLLTGTFGARMLDLGRPRLGPSPRRASALFPGLAPGWRKLLSRHRGRPRVIPARWRDPQSRRERRHRAAFDYLGRQDPGSLYVSRIVAPCPAACSSVAWCRPPE